MKDSIYEDMLEKAKTDYVASQQTLGAYAHEIELLEERISGLRETIVALSRMLRMEPFEEADTLGLTDAIRQAYKTHRGPLVPTDIRKRLEGMGYDTSKYGNLMASVHSVIGRLEKRGEIRSTGTVGGKPAHTWVVKTVPDSFGEGVAKAMAVSSGSGRGAFPDGLGAGLAKAASESAHGTILSGLNQGTIHDKPGGILPTSAAEGTDNSVPSSPNTGTFLDGFGESLARDAGDSLSGTVPSDPSRVSESPQEVTRLLESITQPQKKAR